jgi:hypothetical protein
MKWKPLLWIYNFYAVVLFVALMLPVFLFALPVSLFGHVRGGNLIYKGLQIVGGCLVYIHFYSAEKYL